MTRTSHEVVARAIYLGTLGFRSSLEVSEHPRCKPLCSQLLPWLEELKLDTPMEDFHREILETPYGELSRESQTEAIWCGEGASFLGWAVELFDRPNLFEMIEPSILVDNLKLLRWQARELMASARLRSASEIDDYCAFCITVRHGFQVARLADDGQAILNRIHDSQLAELGLTDAARRLNADDLEVVKAAANSSIQGLYIVRSLTAQWLLGESI